MLVNEENNMNTTTQRKPLIAGFMSLILPGFGQLYNGQLNKGILLFIGFTLSVIPLPTLTLWLPAVFTLPLLIISLLLTLSIWLYAIINAWKQARLQPGYVPKAWQQPATYIGAFLIAMLILSITTDYVRSHLIEAFTIPSSSMLPTVLKGDLLFADKRYNCPGCKHHAQRGDIAIFVYPNNRSWYYIKRIIALPGDRVSIKDQTVFINGQALTQSTAQENDANLVTEKTETSSYQVRWSKNDALTMAEMTVPAGAVFVLGDNRSASNDSRKFGTVPMMDVVGKARQLWFSYGEDGVRWERLGEVVK